MRAFARNARSARRSVASRIIAASRQANATTAIAPRGVRRIERGRFSTRRVTRPARSSRASSTSRRGRANAHGRGRIPAGNFHQNLGKLPALLRASRRIVVAYLSRNCARRRFTRRSATFHQKKACANRSTSARHDRVGRRARLHVSGPVAVARRPARAQAPSAIRSSVAARRTIRGPARVVIPTTARGGGCRCARAILATAASAARPPAR